VAPDLFIIYVVYVFELFFTVVMSAAKFSTGRTVVYCLRGTLNSFYLPVVTAW